MYQLSLCSYIVQLQCVPYIVPYIFVYITYSDIIAYYAYSGIARLGKLIDRVQPKPAECYNRVFDYN